MGMAAHLTFSILLVGLVFLIILLLSQKVNAGKSDERASNDFNQPRATEDRMYESVPNKLDDLGSDAVSDSRALRLLNGYDSFVPTISASPSKSSPPSLSPSISSVPSVAPTEFPSDFPSATPTIMPTKLTGVKKLQTRGPAIMRWAILVPFLFIGFIMWALRQNNSKRRRMTRYCVNPIADEGSIPDEITIPGMASADVELVNASTWKTHVTWGDGTDHNCRVNQVSMFAPSDETSDISTEFVAMK